LRTYRFSLDHDRALDDAPHGRGVFGPIVRMRDVLERHAQQLAGAVARQLAERVVHPQEVPGGGVGLGLSHRRQVEHVPERLALREHLLLALLREETIAGLVLALPRAECDPHGAPQRGVGEAALHEEDVAQRGEGVSCALRRPSR
jgi:hypothetical protein